MKNYVLLVAVALAFATVTLRAQSDDKKKTEPHIGFRGGINFSNIYDMDEQEYVAEGKSGLALGGFIVIPLTEQIGFQPEVMFSQKGFKGTGEIFGADYGFSRTLNFIDIPLQLRLQPVEQLAFVVGPQYSFLLSQVNTFNSDFFDNETREEYDNENVRRNILGVVLGADVIMNNILLSGRASWDLVRNNGDGTDELPRYRNYVIQLTLGVML